MFPTPHGPSIFYVRPRARAKRRLSRLLALAVSLAMAVTSASAAARAYRTHANAPATGAVRALPPMHGAARELLSRTSSLAWPADIAGRRAQLLVDCRDAAARRRTADEEDRHIYRRRIPTHGTDSRWAR